MAHFTAEEAKARNVRFMGEHLGEVYSALWQQVACLYAKWGEYEKLFGTKPSRVELLNKAAPSFFRIVQDSMFDDTMLYIARLTDPPVSRKNRTNLTILALPVLIPHAETRARVEQLVSKAVDVSQFCRDWRNRRIAHADLNLALQKGAKPLMPANRVKIKKALRAIASVLNVISGHYCDSETIFDGPHHTGDAVTLIYVIDDGLKVGAERRARIKRREILPGDFAIRNL